jgi:hypothetical protein
VDCAVREPRFHVHGYDHRKDKEFIAGSFTTRASAQTTANVLNGLYRSRGCYYDVIEGDKPTNLTQAGAT